MEIPRHHESILSDFEHAKTTQNKFVITRVDDHVFIKFPRDKQTFWTPQLHLEINKIDDNSSRLHGLFGPNPTVWTLFMFLHFMVALIFIAFAIWTYTNWSLKENYTVQAGVTLLMVLLWITLYFAGSIGKASSTTDMRLLNNFMNGILNIEEEKGSS
jgi:hypothetical protein